MRAEVILSTRFTHGDYPEYTPNTTYQKPSKVALRKSAKLLQQNRAYRVLHPIRKT